MTTIETNHVRAILEAHDLEPRRFETLPAERREAIGGWIIALERARRIDAGMEAILRQVIRHLAALGAPCCTRRGLRAAEASVEALLFSARQEIEL